jgi:OOP family OmpA-OmpF porin
MMSCKTLSTAAAAASVGMLVLAAPALGQQANPPPSSGSRLNMPYERGFWGYAGIEAGRAKLHSTCPAGLNCDLRDQTWRAFGGGKFNNILGAEVGVMKLGDWTRGGGHTTARGLDAKLTAGWPIGENSSVFGKLGVAYMSTNVSGAGLTTGTNDKWGPTYGIGAQVGINKNWAIRGDIDRYRIQLPGSKDNVDTYMIGAQYSFR